jgi:phospholipase/carboxylesterase
MSSRERISQLPIYIVHGKLDWMFPIDMARVAQRALVGAGANVTYREIADLSHTYPREENGRIMDWLLA